jgi:hypothetical protein
LDLKRRCNVRGDGVAARYCLQTKAPASSGAFLPAKSHSFSQPFFPLSDGRPKRTYPDRRMRANLGSFFTSIALQPVRRPFRSPAENARRPFERGHPKKGD